MTPDALTRLCSAVSRNGVISFNTSQGLIWYEGSVIFYGFKQSLL